MVRQTAAIILLEIAGGLILLLLAAAALLFWRLTAGPIDLAIFKEDVARAVAEARDGRPVSLGAVQLEWSPDDRQVLITAQDIVLMEAAGTPAAEAAQARIALSASALLLGKLQILRLDLAEGWVHADQIGPRQWAIAGDPLPEFPETKLPESVQGWLDYADRILPEWLAALNKAEADLALERVSFTGFEVRLRALDRRDIVTLERAAGRLQRFEDGTEVSFEGRGLGPGLPESLRATMRTREAGKQLVSEFAASGWPLAQLASRTGFSPEVFEGLRTEARLALSLSEDAGIEDVAFELASGPGFVSHSGRDWTVRDLAIAGEYGREVDLLQLRLRSAEAGPLRGGLTLEVERALLGRGFKPVRINSPALSLDLTPMLSAPVEFRDVAILGEIDFDLLSARAVTASFEQNGGRISLSGDVAPTPSRRQGESPVTGNLSVTAPGPLTTQAILALWPVALADGARRFAVEDIRAGIIRDLNGTLTLARDSFTGKYLKDDALQLTFRVDEGEVSFLDDLPPVRGVSGTGRLTGNTFRFLLEKGQFSGWRIEEGLVDFPAFNPRGEKFRVFARGRGPAEPLMQSLVNSRLRINLDPARFSGNGQMTFEMFRPALSYVPLEAHDFSAIGTFSGAGMRAAAFGFDFTDGILKVDVTRTGARVTGAGKLGPSPVDFTWTDGFDDGGAPASLAAKTVVTPDFLNRFGLPGRAYMSGEAPLGITARLDGERLVSANLTADLTATRLDLSELGWVKARSVPARADIFHANDSEGATSRVVFASEGARLDGDFTLGSDSRILSADVRQLVIRGLADVSGTLRRRSDGGLQVTLKGAALDVSGLVRQAGQAAGQASAPEPGRPGVQLDAAVDRLTLRKGLDLRSASVALDFGANGLRRATASGAASSGAPLDASYEASSGSAPRLRITSGDAGFLAAVLIGVDFVKGGALTLDGTLASASKPGKIRIQINDTQLTNAPFLTQILSLGSLRGLADTLAGEGVTFSRVDIPLTVYGSRYILNDAKARGPALGLTASGFIDAKTSLLDVEGVLVPSFGVNSALGGIPLLGDLVVGRDGEGIISLTYSVKGRLEKANVSVNPLSALAPGVARRIFETPPDTTVPAPTAPAPKAPPPKTPLEPIREETF